LFDAFLKNREVKRVEKLTFAIDIHNEGK